MLLTKSIINKGFSPFAIFAGFRNISVLLDGDCHIGARLKACVGHVAPFIGWSCKGSMVWRISSRGVFPPTASSSSNFDRSLVVKVPALSAVCKGLLRCNASIACLFSAIFAGSLSSRCCLRMACSSSSRAFSSSVSVAITSSSSSGDAPLTSLLGEHFSKPSQNLDGMPQWWSSMGVLQPVHLATLFDVVSILITDSLLLSIIKI